MLEDKDLLNVDKLKKFVIDNDIEQVAIKGFWVNFESYKKESPDEFVEVFKCFNVQNLSIKMQTVSIKLGNWPDCSYNHIIINIPIVYKEKVIGKYDALFTFMGEIDDDYFVIY